jgi:WD40 repeat protein
MGHVDAVTHLATPAKANRLASCTFRGEIKVWDVANEKEIASLDNGGPIYGLAMSSDGKRLIANHDTDVNLWDVEKQALIGKYQGGKSRVGRVDFSPDERFVVAQANQTVIWDAKTFAALSFLERSKVTGITITITTDSQALISCDVAGELKLVALPAK